MSEAKKPNLFLFFGENSYFASQKVNLWKSEFIKKYGDETNIEIIEGKNLNIAEFTTNLEALPFLAEKRLIIVKNFLDQGSPEDQKKVAEKLEDLADFCILIFQENKNPDKRTSLYQKIAKTGKLMEFPTPSLNELKNFLIEKCRQEKIHINSQNISYLAEQCALNLWQIHHELIKLKTFANGREISKEEIDQLVVPSPTASVFKLTDSIAAGNRKESLKILKQLSDAGEDPIKVFFMIVRQFRLIIQISDLLSQNENQFSITKKLKLHPFVVKNVMSQCKNFNMEQLGQLYANLLNIDRDFKTGIIKSYQGDNKEFDLAMEKFIIESCQK